MHDRELPQGRTYQRQRSIVWRELFVAGCVTLALLFLGGCTLHAEAANAADAAPENSGVTGLVNTGSFSATTRYDGEPLSTYFNVSIGGTSLYAYPAQVKAINFTPFTSDLTGGTYNPTLTTADPNHTGLPYLQNQGSASFVSFQPTTAGGTNTVVVAFKVAPHVAITSPSQVKLISNVTQNGDGSFNSLGTGNLGPVSIISPGGSYPYGGFSFTVTELVSSTTGYGIPQQITVEIGADAGPGSGHDFLNSLHIFANPHPDPTNGVPGGAVEVSPSVNGAPITIPSGSILHFAAGDYYIQYTGANQDFFFDRILYLDDGAFIKYYTYPVAQGATPTCWVNVECSPMLDINSRTGNAGIMGWGVVDGQAQEQQAAWKGKGSPTFPYPQGVTGPGNCGSGPGPLALGLTNSATQTATVFGIIVENSCSFTMQIGAHGTSTKPVTIDNVKILGYSGGDTPYESNADGMDVFGSSYLNITNSFIRTSDDLITIKQTVFNLNEGGATPSTNINVVHNTLWNEYAHSLVVGGETYNAYNVNQPSNYISADDLLFDSNVVIHDAGKGQSIGVLNGFGGNVQNITFSNMTVMESVGLLGLQLNPGDPAYAITSYSMAPTVTNNGVTTSLVTFTTTSQPDPVAVQNNAVLLSGFPGTGTPTAGFNGQYVIVQPNASPSRTNFIATVIVATPSSSTVTGTVTATGVLQGIPGTQGALHFCNINQTTPQVTTVDIYDTNSLLFVAPIPNIQVEITLPYLNPYVGGATSPWGTTFPKVITEPPTFSNVTVNGAAVSTYEPGNDFYYEAADGLKTTNPATIPSNIVEVTARIEQSNHAMTYLTGVSGDANQLSGDMIFPQIPSQPQTCNVSPLVPVPNPY